MRIAVVQMEIAQGDVRSNLEKMEKLTRKAKRSRADVIVFPEYCVTGSVKGKPWLIDSKDRYRAAFSSLAKRNRIDIVSGSFIERKNGRPYNTSCYFDRTGRLLASYRKINLWHSERRRLAQGKDVVVFDTRFGRVGIAICWDLSNPLLFREMARRGASMIYVPSFWSDAGISNHAIESKNIDALCHARAFENECTIVYANAAGKFAKKDVLIGHSQIVVPTAGAITLLAHNRESFFVADLPAAALARAAKVYKIKKDIVAGY